MTMKRWIAIIVAAALIFVSVGINSLSYIFTRDFNGFFEEMMATSSSGYRKRLLRKETVRIKSLFFHSMVLFRIWGMHHPFSNLGAIIINFS